MNTHRLIGPVLALIMTQGLEAMPERVGARPEAPKARWLLRPFLEMSEQNPNRLLGLAQRLFSPDRLRIVAIEARYAFEWQHRLAMVTALSNLFDPGQKNSISAPQKDQARSIIRNALAQDPSLLVRDGAVESVRRILHMSPAEANQWRAPLERAFLDKQNHIENEGLFIRETILTAMSEGALKPSAQVKKVATQDKNPQVRDLLKTWKTSAYDQL